MGYSYQDERHNVFTESGQKMFLRIRDGVKDALAKTGAITVEKAIAFAGGGSSWTMLACIDRMEELGEIKILNRPDQYGQYRVIVEPNPTSRLM